MQVSGDVICQQNGDGRLEPGGGQWGGSKISEIMSKTPIIIPAIMLDFLRPYSVEKKTKQLKAQSQASYHGNKTETIKVVFPKLGCKFQGT